MKKKAVRVKKKGHKGGEGSRPVVDTGSISEGKRRVLTSFPIRSRSPELKWYKKKDGLVIIKIKKRFSKLEKKLKKIVGGTDLLRIPLDGPGSMVWRLSDGKHRIIDIGKKVSAEFKEEVEPVLPRILRFIELLLKKNLIMLKKAEEIGLKKEKVREQDP